MLERIYRRPLIGLLSLAAGFLTPPLGHAVYKVNENTFGDVAVYTSILMGVLGFVIVWHGLKQGELKATWVGMLGGCMGWFEYSFKFYSVLYDVPGFAVQPSVQNGDVAAPQANMLQATLPIVPTPDNKRSFARITAMEVLFVTWFCYLFWLYAIYLGTRGTGVQIVMGLYLVWTAWAAHLIWKCTQQVRVAPADCGNAQDPRDAAEA